jgi:ribosomal protein L28
MGKQCNICEKTSVMVVIRKKLRGKYNPTNKKRKYPNLQWGRVNGKRIKMCAKCLKAQGKTR